MIRIAIAGGAGRMGRALLSAGDADDRVSVVHVFERPDHESVGRSACALVDIQSSQLSVCEGIAGPPFDVLIDFTSPESTLINLDYCAANGIKAVIGTTGFSVQQQEHIRRVAEKIAIVWAPNMSVGVNITLKLLEVAAKAFGNDADIEVIEAHHRHKVDAPSGTALKMGEVVAKALGRNLSDHGVFAREGAVGPRADREIGFSTIRAADVVGEHSVWFAGSGERVEIVHKATSREIYALGAIRSTVWVADQDVGLFDMQDVLGIKDVTG